MSQFQSYPPGNVPPGQFPPGQIPPPYPGNMYGQPPARTSGAAITALILGILGCVPLLTSIAAIIFGIVGIASTRKPGVNGRGLAIAGIVLGLIGILGWTGFGGMMTYAYVQTKPDRALASSFVQDLAAGNEQAAQLLCIPGISSAQLQQSITQLQSFGPMKSFLPLGFKYNSMNGSGSDVITCIATFNSTSKSIIITVRHLQSGTPLVESWQIQ